MILTAIVSFLKFPKPTCAVIKCILSIKLTYTTRCYNSEFLFLAVQQAMSHMRFRTCHLTPCQNLLHMLCFLEIPCIYILDFRTFYWTIFESPEMGRNLGTNSSNVYFVINIKYTSKTIFNLQTSRYSSLDQITFLSEKFSRHVRDIMGTQIRGHLNKASGKDDAGLGRHTGMFKKLQAQTYTHVQYKRSDKYRHQMKPHQSFHNGRNSVGIRWQYFRPFRSRTLDPSA